MSAEKAANRLLMVYPPSGSWIPNACSFFSWNSAPWRARMSAMPGRAPAAVYTAGSDAVTL
jgi:hypothetical protein